MDCPTQGLLPVSISWKMHPKAQMSTGQSYPSGGISIVSGAIQKRMPVIAVFAGDVFFFDRTNQDILQMPEDVTSTLSRVRFYFYNEYNLRVREGSKRTRWRISFEWRYSKPDKIWREKYLTRSRSKSPCSNTI